MNQKKRLWRSGAAILCALLLACSYLTACDSDTAGGEASPPSSGSASAEPSEESAPEPTEPDASGSEKEPEASEGEPSGGEDPASSERDPGEESSSQADSSQSVPDASVLSANTEEAEAEEEAPAEPASPGTGTRGSKTNVLVPSAPGTATDSGGGATVDYSNASEGYVMVSYSGSASKVKVQITGSNGNTYTYNLNTGGTYEVFPLTSGSGTYTINVFENVYDNQYALDLGASVYAELRSSLLPYLYPNQYVDFWSGSTAVAKGSELAATANSDLEVVQNVYNYVINNVSYDDALANQISAGGVTTYLPSVDYTLSCGTGICFDYASLMAAMLRSQGIPTRLEVGWVSGGIYHAWVSVYLTESGWVNGIIQFNGNSWKLMDPTFASNGNSSSSIMQFIGNGSNYSAKFVY